MSCSNSEDEEEEEEPLLPLYEDDDDDGGLATLLTVMDEEGDNDNDAERVRQQQQPAPSMCVPETVLARLRPPAPKEEVGDDGLLQVVVLDIIVRRGRGQSTEALLVGRAKDGLSACLRVTGWYPYLFVRAPHAWNDAPHAYTTLKALLQEKLETYFSKRRVPEGVNLPPPPPCSLFGGKKKARAASSFIHQISLVRERRNVCIF